MTAWGVVSTPSSRTEKDFCHSWPKPWSGPDTRLPVTPSSFAPVTPAADRRSTGRPHVAPPGFVGSASGVHSFVPAIPRSPLSGDGGGDSRGFVVMDLDRLVEP